MNVNKEFLLKRIDELCDSKHIKPHTAFTESGVGKNFRSNLTSSNPSEGKITMLANYFGVSVDYLVGNTNEPTPKLEPKAGTAFFLTAQEAKVLTAYRDQPDMQPAVDRILGVTEDGYVTVYTAANSTSNRKHTITKIPREKWEEIENAPNTDEDLL